MKFWTPSKISHLRTLAKTMTAAQLAFEFHTTRGAIIGLCSRQEIPLTAFANMLHPQGRAARMSRKKPIIMNNGTVKNNEHKPLPPDRVESRQSGVWASVGCLAVIGEPKDKIGCCQQTVVDGVYCAAHHAEFRVRPIVRGR